MVRKQERDIVVGLDIGTSKLLAIVAEINDEGELDIIGMGHHPARGMRRGVVADIESTVESMRRALEEAELMSGCQIMSAYVGIAGAHINSFNSHGVVAIRDGEVSHDDVERVLEAGQAIAIPNDQKILHVLPQEFIIDGQEEIKEPLGMCGVRLEAKVHVITGAVSSVQNIVKCVRRCGIEVDDIVLEQLASSEAVLNEDEKKIGVAMIDIGGGTTDIAVFQNGTIQHTAVIPIAGDQITNDIGVALHTPTQAAEEIKKKYGCALASLVGADETIEAEVIGSPEKKSLSRHSLAEVIEPRIEEIFQLVQNELRRSGYEEMVTSLVITGGTSRLEAARELAEEIFHVPVRLGLPRYEGSLSETVLNPIYSTGIGLIKFGHRGGGKPIREPMKKPSSFSTLFEKMKTWFKGSF